MAIYEILDIARSDAYYYEREELVGLFAEVGDPKSDLGPVGTGGYRYATCNIIDAKGNTRHITFAYVMLLEVSQ